MKNYLNNLELLVSGREILSKNLAQTAYEKAILPNKKDLHWRFSDVDFWANIASKALPKMLDFSSFDSPNFSRLTENDFVKRAFFALISGGKFDAYLASKIGFANIVNIGKNERVSLDENLESPINIFILEENSALNLKCEKVFASSKNLSASASFFYVGKNASLNFASNFSCEGDSPRYTRADFYLQGGAKLNDVFIERGNSNTRCERNAFILGENADANLAGLFVADKKITHDFRTSQINMSPSSRTNLLVKNLLSGTAKSAFTGLIRVNENAQKTQSYQSCKSLLMSQDARAQAAPILEILTNDVECSHGCSVSRPDSEQIFYMKSRGLNDAQTRQLISAAFASEILSRITW